MLASLMLGGLAARLTRPEADFRNPEGEAALIPADSVSWRVFSNPVSLFVGGVAAVLLELAEPRVRTGVWEHSSFRSEPARRMQRTGLAALVTVYGARSVAERMIAGVRRVHESVAGVTPDGAPYAASDPELLDWVHATASFGFLEAWCAFVRPLGAAERDRYYREGAVPAALYGAQRPPRSVAEQRALFAAMLPKLERSDIVFEFLDIVRRAPLLPRPLRPVQRLLVRAAIEIVPPEIRERLGLERLRPRGWELALVRSAGRIAGRLHIPGPWQEACARLGLPPDYPRRG